uniref:Amphiphysin n=1 Tax=Oreochromis aureus TaxID=47969 RepID=A0A668TUL4_OREAU
MAEIKTGIFAKNVQKRLNRAQEKVLQKLGKADETKDEQFEQVVINFRRQESEGSRLQREMKAYMSAIKGMQASINLTESLHEVYEPDWHGKDDDCDALWEDFHNKLVDSTLLNLDAYLQQFPDLKAINTAKLIDYDSARHHMETMQTPGMKNDRKMMKAEEELKKAQKVFDELNTGLQEELPTLWDRKRLKLLTNKLLQHSDKIFTIQGAPSDSGPLRLARTPSPPEDESPPDSPDLSTNHMLRPISPGPPRPKSPTQLKRGPPVPPPPKVTPTKEVAEEQIIDLFGGEFLPAPSPSQPNERPGESLLDLDFDAFQPDETGCRYRFVADWSADFGSVSANGEDSSGAEEPAILGGSDYSGWPQGEGIQPGGESTAITGDSEIAPAEDEVSSWESQPNSNLHSSLCCGEDDRKYANPSVVIEPASSNEGDDDRDADIISPTAISDNGVTTENQNIKHISPSGERLDFLMISFYKVETMHDFEAANSDELDLKRGDVVLVVPTASAEDQDAGWLTGIKESDWLTFGAGAQKGLFPENFTQHLE